MPCDALPGLPGGDDRTPFRIFRRTYYLLLGSVLTVRFPSDPGSAALLESALQLLAAPIGLVQIIIGQLTPLLPDLAFGCLPVSFDAVPIHFVCDLPKLNGQSTAEQS